MKQPSFSYLGKVKDLSSLRSMITISGNSEVLIENCRQVNECNDIRCSVVASGDLIDVWGAELSLSSFSNGSVAVNGKIQSLNIEKRGRKESI